MVDGLAAWCDDFEDFLCLEDFDLDDLLERSRTASALTKSRFAPALNGCGPIWPAAASEGVSGRLMELAARNDVGIAGFGRTSRSSILIVNAPDSTKKNSSVSGWL